MPLIGRTLARLAVRTNGQLMLELPDELSPSFVATLVAGANSEVETTPEFALFVHGQRQDVEAISPRVDLRELAMYRQGAHLAISFASDNRGMSTYSSVYPLLLSNGFPTRAAATGGTGVVGIDDFSSTLSEVLLEQVGAHGLSAEDFRNAVGAVLQFLSKAYEAAGNGQASFAADWWIHVHDWVESLAIPVAATNPNGVARLYGCAGLPVPADGYSLSLKPEKYVSTLIERWSNPSAIAGELARLQGEEGAKAAALILSSLDWEGSHAITSLRSDSPVSRVALAAGVNRVDRCKGWSLLKESDFSSYLNAKGKLIVRRAGSDLPVPWKNASPVLVAHPGEYDAATGDLRIADIELVIPFRPDADRSSLPEDVSRAIGQIEVSGSRNCVARLDVQGAEFVGGGLALRGSLVAIPSKKAPSLVWMEVSAIGDLVSALVDRCDGSFTILKPNEVGLWARPSGRNTKSSMRGPVIWPGNGDGMVTLELSEPGIHDIALAWGASSGASADSLAVREVLLVQPWQGLDDQGAQGSVEIVQDAEITVAGRPLFQLELVSNSDRPLSPIIAAARGLRPNTSLLLSEGTLDYFEGMLGDILSKLAGHSLALGSVLATATYQRNGFEEARQGVFCTPDLKNRSDLSPSFPSTELLNHPAYESLRTAYVALGIPEIIAGLESSEGTAGLTVSRIPLDQIPKEAIDQLLKAYRALLDIASTLPSTDRFWARNPFSIAVFGESGGLQSAQAVLLSPLHPIRLAWLWTLQVGLREAYDDGAGPAASLALLEGTHFPASVVIDDPFGAPAALMPVAIDARPGDLYLGWHASVAIIDYRAAIPEWIAGYRFPVDGLSALSAGSVQAAIDDFMRVSPHVQSLKLELTAANPSRRSSALDDGILAKLRELALGSAGLDGVAGIRVLDSERRIGPIPRFSDIEDSLALARPGFNAEWVSVTPEQTTGSHVTFLEGSAARLAMANIAAPAVGWLPNTPLRRTPRRIRQQSFTTLDYALAPTEQEGELFPIVIRAYESSTDGGSYALKVIPSLAGITGKPSWLVAGDFGVDPQALSHAAKTQSSGDYVLWDWRPATTVRPNRHVSSRAQPYFVLAQVPPALSSAIRNRLLQLNGKLDALATETRTKLLINTLAARAVGLNTLLSIGHHQATGALGFFFALKSLESWMESAPQGEARLVIPVDAVDPFLRTSVANAGDGSRNRADLLALRAYIGKDGRARVILLPIEIKHYGLGKGEQETAFPLAGESRLSGHVEQLNSYQKQLQGLCEAYRDAVGSQASILGQRLVAILDAAMQLGTNDGISALLPCVARGTADVELGKGLLLWYQAGASNQDGSKASWDEVGGTLETRRIDIHVDPAAFDGCFWDGVDGPAHRVVREALANASASEDQDVAIVTTPNESQPSDSNAAPMEDNRSPVEAADRSVAAEQNAGPIPSSAKSDTPDAVGSGAASDIAARSKLSNSVLEKRYATLLAALGEFNVKVERPRGQVPYQEGPAFVEFAVSPSYGVSVNRIESQLENLKLRLKLPSEAVIGCSTHMGNVLLTVPKSDDERYFVDALELWGRWRRPATGFKIPVGEDVAGDIVEIDLANSNSPHLLIAGVTGSGKSEALLTLLHGATRFYGPDELRLRLVDPKQTELNTLAGLAHTDGEIGWSGEEAIALLEEAVKEMDRRYEAFRMAGSSVRNIAEYREAVGPMARWLIVLDEYADLVSDDSERKLIEKCLQRLSQKARASGIHVIVSTQKPVVQVVNTVVKGNLPGKIALRVNTAMESRVILDESGAEQLVGKGDAILKAGNGKTRVQFARYQI